MKEKRNTKVEDNRKADEVKTHIDNHREIDTSDIAVQVDNGHVSLTGDIDNGSAKKLVTEIVNSELSGVKSVTNDITFRRDMGEAVTVEEVVEVDVVKK